MKNLIKFIIIATCLTLCCGLSSCGTIRTEVYDPTYYVPASRTVYYYPRTYYLPAPPPPHKHHHVTPPPRHPRVTPPNRRGRR